MDNRVDDLGFEYYRRERLRRRAGAGGTPVGESAPEEARRCLQEADQHEIRDRQLNNEVQEFFEIATKTAANIVNQVAKSAQEKKAEQIAAEMEDFLLDAFEHMRHLVAASLARRRNGTREERVEPSMQNLVGAALDEFRAQGTAELPDKHMGQDPFRTDPDEVCREFRAQAPEPAKSDEIIKLDRMPIPMRAAMSRLEQPAEPGGSVEPATAAAPDATAAPAMATEPVGAAAPTTAGEPTLAAPATAVEPGFAGGDAALAAPGTTPSATPARPKKVTAEQARGLEQLKANLRKLVDQGIMSREEATAVWGKRLASVGIK
jgi:hypothetical protein